MGAGKTTLGQELSRILTWRFADLDDIIQARENQSIEEIFEHRGESAFRELERMVLLETLLNSDSASLVLALGGGAFVDEENQRTLIEAGAVAVFLDATAPELYERCALADAARPLRRDLQQFSALYESRRSSYLKAQIHVQTSGRAIPSIADDVISKLRLRPGGAFE